MDLSSISLVCFELSVLTPEGVILTNRQLFFFNVRSVVSISEGPSQWSSFHQKCCRKENGFATCL